jgi:hypothetical protein
VARRKSPLQHLLPHPWKLPLLRQLLPPNPQRLLLPTQLQPLPPLLLLMPPLLLPTLPRPLLMLLPPLLLALPQPSKSLQALGRPHGWPLPRPRTARFGAFFMAFFVFGAEIACI